MTQYSGIFTLPQQAQALTSGKWATDPYFKNTTLLLHADGIPGGAQNNTFLDSSSNAFAITRNGNTTQGTFSPYMPNGYWSNYFDGSGDYLSVASNSAFDLGASDFTIEAWIFPTALTNGYSIASRYNSVSGTGSGWGFRVVDSSTIRFFRGNDVVLNGSTTITVNSWAHVAAVRNGSTLTIFVNGTQVAQATGISNFTDASTSLQVGLTNTGSDYANGYTSNLRIVKGTAVYTSNFTPSTAPLTAISGTSLLTCQSNRFLDNSTNAFTVTPAGDVKVQQFQPFMRPYQYSTSVIGGSGYFDGTGDYLTAASNAAFAFGTGDYTVEFWMYPFAITNQRALLDIGNATWQIYNTTSGTVVFYNGADRITSSALTNNQWYHVAISRASNSTKMFINGVQAGSTYTDSTNYSGPYGVGIADKLDGTLSEYNGYITDARIVKGTAVYTSNFTPPTAPLTAITNTSLLCNMTNAGIYDNAMQNNLETVGNAQVSTSVVKYGSGSMYFDGSGDYLQAPSSPAFDFGSGDFTVEMWINPSTVSSLGVLYDQWAAGLGSYVTGQCEIQVNASAKIVFYVATGASTYSTLTSTTSISASVWTHIALVRFGSASGNVKLYINGIADATTLTHTGQTGLSNRVLGVGTEIRTGAGTYYTGYIDDLRITKGVARYTSNFQPPQVAFANQ